MIDGVELTVFILYAIIRTVLSVVWFFIRAAVIVALFLTAVWLIARALACGLS